MWLAEDTQLAAPIIVTCSIGIAIYSLHGVTREELVENEASSTVWPQSSLPIMNGGMVMAIPEAWPQRLFPSPLAFFQSWTPMMP